MSSPWFILVCRFYCCLSIKGNIKRRAARRCVSPAAISLYVCALGDHGAFGSFLPPLCVRDIAHEPQTPPPQWHFQHHGQSDIAILRQNNAWEMTACGIQLALIYISPNRYQMRPIANYLSHKWVCIKNVFFWSCTRKRQEKEKERIPRQEFWLTATAWYARGEKNCAADAWWMIS